MPQIAASKVPMSKRITFRFDPKKAIEVILYIADQVAEPSFHRISKILYFADRNHLENYGRFICGDSYVAMKHGPVPSNTYDILKFVRGDDGLTCPVPSAAESFRVDDNKLVVPYKKSDLSVLSESDKECLDTAITEYGRLSFTQLTKLSHDKAWESADENEFIDIEQIVATLADADRLLQHLSEPHPD